MLSHEGADVEIKSWNGGTLTPRAAALCRAGDEDDLWVCPAPERIVATLGAGDDDLVIYRNPPFAIPLEADGGAGNDRLWGGSGPDVLTGGPGDDRLNGEEGDDRLFGGDGDDVLTGRLGNDLLDGGAGNDSLEDGDAAPLGAADLGAGADTYVGGPGTDRFSYYDRTAPVSVTLDGAADDGEAGEGDNAHADIESVGGGSGNDVLVGSPGSDHLWGSDGDDILVGGPGDDTLDGGCMSDTLIGGPGRDTFNSDGSCSFSLRSPFDRIEARDGEPDALIFCQRTGDLAGDVAVVDAVDPVATSGPGACATVLVPTSEAPPAPIADTPPAPTTGKTLLKLGSSARLLAGSGQRVDLKRKRITLGTLAATARTRVTVTVTTRKITLAKRTVAVAANRSKTLSLPLSKRGRAALAKQKRASVAVTFAVGTKQYRKTFRIAIQGAK